MWPSVSKDGPGIDMLIMAHATGNHETLHSWLIGKSFENWSWIQKLGISMWG